MKIAKQEIQATIQLLQMLLALPDELDIGDEATSETEATAAATPAVSTESASSEEAPKASAIFPCFCQW